MSAIITVENYEAFYLDFLEENLDKEQAAAFELFLEQHPELKIEVDLNLKLEDKNPTLDKTFLNSIKVFDVWETISEDNCEQFMIASVENIIPATKQIELNDFLAKRNDLRSDYTYFQQTKLVADSEVVYSEKAKLKKGVVIPMYAKMIAVAASIILILMLVPFQNSKEPLNLAQKRNLIEPKNKVEQNTFIANNQSLVSETKVNKKRKIDKTLIDENQIVNASFTRLEPLKVSSVNSNSSSDEIALASFPLKTEIATDEENSTYLAVYEMKNPISFVTNEINTRFKTDVDLRTAKATKNKQGGFYLKIGKLEISRKVKPVEELALY